MNRPSDALAGVRIVTLAPNVPGPAAAARLRDFGADVVTVEPPGGDPLAGIAPRWYADLHRDMVVERLDLKSPDGRAALDAHLAAAQVLLTSSRPSALERLGLGWDALHARFPQLDMVAIVGELPPNAEHAGHDLTYVAQLGLVDPPHLPRTLIADLAGAERAVSATFALVLARMRRGDNVGAHAYVALRDAAVALARPYAEGLTAPGGRLAGTFPGYRIYATADGWIAIAALEPHFWARLRALLGDGKDDAEQFAAAFARENNATWTAWAREHDMPLVAFT